jgi:hypothetical protein
LYFKCNSKRFMEQGTRFMVYGSRYRVHGFPFIPTSISPLCAIFKSSNYLIIKFSKITASRSSNFLLLYSLFTFHEISFHFSSRFTFHGKSLHVSRKISSRFTKYLFTSLHVFTLSLSKGHGKSFHFLNKHRKTK